MIYLILIAGSIFTLDVIDNSSDIREPTFNEEDKKLIIEKINIKSLFTNIDRETLTISFILMFTLPVTVIINTIHLLSNPTLTFYIDEISLIEIIFPVVVYILLPLFWIVFTIFLKRKYSFHLNGENAFNKKLFLLLSTIFLFIGCFSTSYFAVLATFENFKGFF